jgi:hypothetical protein
MNAQCNQQQIEFHALAPHTRVRALNEGQINSDAVALFAKVGGSFHGYFAELGTTV